MQRFAETRPLFKDDPEKYIGMDPMDACRELGITLAQLVQLVDAEEDIFPNPRYKLVAKQPRPGSFRERVFQARANRVPVTLRMPPPFNIDSPEGADLEKKIDSPGGVALGMKIGQIVGNSKVSDPATSSHFCPFLSRSKISA